MTKFVGRRVGIAIGKEASRGVPQSTTLFWVPFAKLSFDDKTITVRETQGLGKIADGDSAYVTQKSADGSIDAEVYDKALGLFLLSLMGSETPSGSNPTTHTYTLSNTNQHQSISIFAQDPDNTKVFANSVVDSWKMTIATNAIVEHSWGFMSRSSDDFSTLTPAYTSLGLKYLHQNLSFKLATTIGGLAGATKIALKSLELNVNANTMLDSALGTVEPQDILNQQFQVSGKITLNKNDDTYRQLMLAGTYNACEIKLTNTTNSILTIQLPRVHFTNWQQDRTLDKIVPQTIEFTGNYDAANALDIISTLTLANLQTTY